MKDKNLIHDLRGCLDQLNTCLECIVLDLKEGNVPSEDDVIDAEKSIEGFKMLFEQLKLKNEKKVKNGH